MADHLGVEIKPMRDIALAWRVTSLKSTRFEPTLDQDFSCDDVS